MDIFCIARRDLSTRYGACLVLGRDAANERKADASEIDNSSSYE
jgi:hypothetical protein